MPNHDIYMTIIDLGRSDAGQFPASLESTLHEDPPMIQSAVSVYSAPGMWNWPRWDRELVYQIMGNRPQMVPLTVCSTGRVVYGFFQRALTCCNQWRAINS